MTPSVVLVLVLVSGKSIGINSYHRKPALTLYVNHQISMIHIGIRGSSELAISYQRRLSPQAGNNSQEGISLWHNFDDKRTWG